MLKIIHVWLVLSLLSFSFFNSFGLGRPTQVKNVLLINSYHEGFLWTDSVTSGIIQALKLHPEINLFIENLNSKKFGQSMFELERNYFQQKYAGTRFSGIMVTDNDALDFAEKYNKELFPGIPVVFAGISNPEDYSLEGSQFYGLKETSNSDIILSFVRQVIPQTKHLLVLTDLTTTGLIYRKELMKYDSEINDLSVEFPRIIDMDSIYSMVSSVNKYDAIYYIGVSQDKDGRLVDSFSFLNSIIKLAKVPVFNNDPLFNGKGVVGGLYQSGKKHGEATFNLLIRLLDSTAQRPAKRFETTGNNYFFDRKILDEYKIPVSRLPEGSIVLNNPIALNKKYFLGLFAAITFLGLIVIVLSYYFRKAKKAEQQIKKQFKKIKSQNKKLEEAHLELSSVISELENTNRQLEETNINLLAAKKKAEESDNLKSAFLANVSHEIRTPLNSIVGFSSLLSESDLTEETRNVYIDLIESNTESLLVLIDEIIDLSKIEAQQLTIKKQEFNVDNLLSELFEIFNHGHKNQAVELRMAKIPGSGELFVNSDKVRVKQVFINLLSNACKFTDSGFIEFGYLENEKKEILLFVRDSGIGIREEFHQAIFERFRKLNNDGVKVYRGTGLGLAITKKLIELLGGTIRIKSKPYEGTTFYFSIQELEYRSKTN